MTLALLFPGQGSQYVGMARDLADTFSTATEVLTEANDVLGFDLAGLMAEGPEDELTATRNAQPAILTHSVAVLRLVRERLGPVAMAAGHSLGEFSAHVAAGTLSFRDALEAVRLRGELMFNTGEERPGTMAAVLGLDDDVLEEVCAQVEDGVCVPANFNSRGQIVISGDVVGVERGMELAEEAGARRVVRLNVSGAFHSPLMAPAAAGLREKLESIEMRDPDYPIVSNVTARAVTTGSEAQDLLVEQLTSPVRWAESVKTMVEAGVDQFFELGPGSVLTGLNRRNAKKLPCASVGELGDLEPFGMGV